MRRRCSRRSLRGSSRSKGGSESAPHRARNSTSVSHSRRSSPSRFTAGVSRRRSRRRRTVTHPSTGVRCGDLSRSVACGGWTADGRWTAATSSRSSRRTPATSRGTCWRSRTRATRSAMAQPRGRSPCSTSPPPTSGLRFSPTSGRPPRSRSSALTARSSRRRSSSCTSSRRRCATSIARCAPAACCSRASRASAGSTTRPASTRTTGASRRRPRDGSSPAASAPAT